MLGGTPRWRGFRTLRRWGGAALVAALSTASAGLASAAADDGEDEALGPPPLYDELRDARPEGVGRIRGGRLEIDRFAFELTDGDVYVVRIGAHVPIAIYLGRGTLRAWPPDGVEHQQMRKLLDEDFLEEEFERLVFWTTGDVGARLAALASGPPGRRAGRAADLLEDRREELLERQLANPDSRVVMALWRAEADPPLRPPARPYVYADIDGREHDWFAFQIEPRDPEEVQLARFRRRHERTEVWMSTDVLTDFDPARAASLAAGGPPRDPDVQGPAGPRRDRDDEWDFRDFGLPLRPARPDAEGWAPRVTVPRTDVDLALEGNGDAAGSVALVVEPLAPLAAVRLRISTTLEVTDARWRPAVPEGVDDVRGVPLLPPPEDPGEPPEPDEPVALGGERVHFVQEKHDRRMEEDRYEPWVTVLLPRPVAPGEPFVLELAYEGELVERLRATNEFLLQDPLHWTPPHPHHRRRQLNVTFRMPDRYRVASGGALVEERVDDGTRIMRWVTDRALRGTTSFHYGRFEVDEVALDGLPPIAVYANRHHLGFAPGARQKTMDDLAGAIRTYTDYFGPYPFDSLLVTETPTSGGQAFPGFLLLSFRSFGELHTGESELFRAHEVAHQWWGASVDWEGYRDQWMTEGFANYAAALYALVGLGNEDQFEDMLDAWRLDVLGEIRIGQGLGLQRYGLRPAIIRESDAHESGPVVAGVRLSTVDTPFDYRLLAYEKGALILHMLRMLLVDLETGDDTRFREMMRAFVRDYTGRVANTHAFEEAVRRAFGEPMDWFFDQWVYGTDVPTYRPDLAVSPLVDGREPFALHGTIRQEDVPDGFRMPVPIRLEFRDRPPETHRVWVDAEVVEVEIPIPERPTEITFNHLHAVLARVD
ncbi:MAG: M1 family aminopeptidase [Acidobacteria bacterium]|nr:M1 family aminopeptidase [Acidobacteriota bacterium]